MKHKHLLIPLVMILAVTGAGSLAVANAGQDPAPASSEAALYDEEGCIDLSQVKEQVIKDMFDDQGCWVHPYQKHVDAAKDNPGGYGGFYFEDTVVYVYMEDPGQFEAARDAFNQAYDGDREITEIRAVQGRYSADKLWDWRQALEDGDSAAGIETAGSGIRFGDNRIHFTVRSVDQEAAMHALMDTLSIPRDAVDISCCGGVRWGTPWTIEQWQIEDSDAGEVNTISVGPGYFGVPSVGEATRRADLVAIAQVGLVVEAFWNISDGQRPDVSDRDLLLMPSARIFTPYVLTISEVLKGTAQAGDQLVLNQLGGQVGNDHFVLEGDPLSFEPGTTVLVFLRDCGAERVERLGSEGFRYILISRYEIDGDEATLGDSRALKDEVIATVESNKSGEPQAEASC